MKNKLKKLTAALLALVMASGLFAVMPLTASAAEFQTEPMIAASSGRNRVFILKSDGTVWTWQMTGITYPQQVPNLSGITVIASGTGGSPGHTLALKNDGTVWAWGDNYFGQLGDGTTTNRNIPVQVQNISEVTAIAAGDFFSLLLKSDGTVWARGSNYCGELGNGTTDRAPHPTLTQVQGLSGITDIAAGGSYSLALKDDGTVWAWGYHGYGHFSTSSVTDSPIPVQVQNLSEISQQPDKP